jgi:hypothetical protein
MRSSFVQLALALAALAAAIAGYWFWYGAVAATSVSVTALQGRIDANMDTASRRAAALAALAGMAGDEAAMRDYFVSETGIVAFIDGLEALGRSIGSTTVSVLSVSASGTGERPAFKFSLLVKGTFDGVMRTVGAIEYAPYAISISSLSVAKNVKNDWQAAIVFLAGSATSTPAHAP